MAIRLTLTPYDDYTLEFTPEMLAILGKDNIISQALEDDPSATEIKIINPLVTPVLLQALSDFTKGKGPTTELKGVAEVVKYLNLDPYYELYLTPAWTQLPNKVDYNDPANAEYILQEIDMEGPGFMWAYLYLAHPAAESYRLGMVLGDAVSAGNVALVTSLIAAPLLQDEDYYLAEYLRTAINKQRWDLAKLLLARRTPKPNWNLINLMIPLVEAKQPELLAMLLEHIKQIPPIRTIGGDLKVQKITEAFTKALDLGYIDSAQLLLPYLNLTDMHIELQIENAIDRSDPTTAWFLLNQATAGLIPRGARRNALVKHVLNAGYPEMAEFITTQLP